MPPNRRRLPLVSLLAILPLAAACAVLPQGASAPLTARDQQVVDGLGPLLDGGAITAMGDQGGDRSATAITPVAGGFSVQDDDDVVVPQLTDDGYYLGPFPKAPESLAANELKRPAVGWLSQNPAVSSAGGLTATETYWSPNGDTTSAADYTKTSVNAAGETVLDLYAHPIKQGGLPSFFQQKIGLQAGSGWTSWQYHETYRVYQIAPQRGSALGYRWVVKDASGNLTAWVRALQISQADGTKVDTYNFCSNYRNIDGAVRPTRYVYGTRYEQDGHGGDLDQSLDPATGNVNGSGSYLFEYKNHDFRVHYTEVIRTDGTVTRTLKLAREVDAVENYNADGSGTGTISFDSDDRDHDAPRATMKWDTTQHGTLKLGRITKPYWATRYYPPS